MDHSELRSMAKKRHEKNVVSGDVNKAVEHEMTRHKKAMAEGGSSSVFGSNPVKNGPTDQLKNSMNNFGPSKLGGRGMKKGGCVK